jgi:uncharacterized protein (TIGR00369 family)
MKNEDTRLSILKKDSVQGFAGYIGMIAVSLMPGKFVTRLKLTEHHLQPDGFAHAGLIATMADQTAGFAGASILPENNHLLTVQFSVNYLRPAVGSILECKAQVIKPGKQIVYTEAEVFSVNGRTKKLVARATHTGTSIPKPKA